MPNVSTHPASKIVSRDTLARVRDEFAARGQKLVFTNGCFDLLHVGHVRYLQEARALGDALAVAVNGDASVRALKGPSRPVNGQDDRAEVLAALECVDYVVVYPETSETRMTGLLRAVRPQVYAKGGDYTPETLDAEERGALVEAGSEIRILPLVPGRSTTRILESANAGLTGSAGSPAERAPLNIGVLGSGKGSNFAAIAAAIDAGTVPAEVRIVISDFEDAGILNLARARGIRAEYVAPGRFKTKLEPEAEARVVELLREAGVELVVLAGYMRMVKAPLLEAFPERIINIHPSLLPKYPGLMAWKQAVEDGAAVTGCTVHYVDTGMDTGPIIAQKEVPVLPGDTAETLHARIQEAEHALYPAVVAKLARER